jgi:hypothetical protein
MNTFTIESGKASFSRFALFIAQCAFVTTLVTILISSIGLTAMVCIDSLYRYYASGGN